MYIFLGFLKSLFSGSSSPPAHQPSSPPTLHLSWAELLLGDDGAVKVEAPLGCWALGALCAVGDAVKKKKGCATHTAGMSCMQSIESVSSGRQRREEVGEEGSSLEEPGCTGGSLLEVGSAPTEKDEAQNSLPLLLLFLIQKHTHTLTHTPP